MEKRSVVINLDGFSYNVQFIFTKGDPQSEYEVWIDDQSSYKFYAVSDKRHAIPNDLYVFHYEFNPDATPFQIAMGDKIWQYHILQPCYYKDNAFS